MNIGFIHGVMNTDNTTISGETIDFGPCAFLDIYNSSKVFSSIDQFGRYSYSNQPLIAQWNLARFAEALIPIINLDEKICIKLVTEIISEFFHDYKNNWMQGIRKKLGLLSKKSLKGSSKKKGGASLDSLSSSSSLNSFSERILTTEGE